MILLSIANLVRPVVSTASRKIKRVGGQGAVWKGRTMATGESGAVGAQNCYPDVRHSLQITAVPKRTRTQQKLPELSALKSWVAGAHKGVGTLVALMQFSD